MGFFQKKKQDFIKIKVEPLIDWNEPNGEGCIVSDYITKAGYKVGYMVRETPMDTNPDSGWRFMAGNEDDAFMSNSDNHHVFAINTICNYDRDILPYIHAGVGSAYIRIDEKTFELDNASKPIFIMKQSHKNSAQ